MSPWGDIPTEQLRGDVSIDQQQGPLQALTAARPPVTVPVMRIEVHDNQVESALKTMKKLMLKDGLFKEMKKRAYYEKPSVKRKRKQAEARKKRRKAMKRAEQDD